MELTSRLPPLAAFFGEPVAEPVRFPSLSDVRRDVKALRDAGDADALAAYLHLVRDEACSVAVAAGLGEMERPDELREVLVYVNAERARIGAERSAEPEPEPEPEDGPAERISHALRALAEPDEADDELADRLAADSPGAPFGGKGGVFDRWSGDEIGQSATTARRVLDKAGCYAEGKRGVRGSALRERIRATLRLTKGGRL